MGPTYFLKEMENSKSDTVFFRKFINLASSPNHSLDCDGLKEWQAVLAYILDIFATDREVERERILLASHAFFAILCTQYHVNEVKNTISDFLYLDSNQLIFASRKYNIADLILFKLICVHGYLQASHKRLYQHDVCLIIFDIIYENCMKYSKHFYFAYRVLHLWLDRTMSTDFWNTYNLKVEERLETIIFSNWCNAITEISKQNSGPIFHMYLQIMASKYEGFFKFIFHNSVNNISWQNEVKYAILAEICEVWNNIEIMTSSDFLLALSTCLTKNYLRSAGTKVFLSITKKLNEEEWKTSFGGVMKFLFEYWGMSENANRNALHTLCKNWLEPIVKKYRNLLSYLYNLANQPNQYFLKSHLLRMASELRVLLTENNDVDLFVHHEDEIIRLNGFAICCYGMNDSINVKQYLPMIKDFLWHNANSTSVYMREGIVKYFKVFYTNFLKLCDTNPEVVDDLYYITHWLHNFLLDCLEIGSCYQRKIFGLNLYKAILSFSNGSALGKSNNMENAHCAMLLEKHLQATGNWKFIDKKSLFLLLRLVLDSSSDVKQLASCIILDFFGMVDITNSEKQVLKNVAMEHCNSSEFYKIESGAALISLLATWLPLGPLQDVDGKKGALKYSEFLFNEATDQLAIMKLDILKAIVQNKPVYGALTALLKVSFRNGPEKSELSLEFAEKILDLLKDVTDFFLSVFCLKSKNIEYSSSFAEMGLAIDETIRISEVGDANYDELNLTPAHQVLISCIWMSLKVSCEIASEIGMLRLSKETVETSSNIITKVLFRCRHKGVVESAGVAIGNLMGALCKDSRYSELPKFHVRNILLHNAEKRLNITRRGAGLTIMFHKIIVSDNRRDRPLLHFAIQLLLDMLNDPKDSEVIESQESDSPLAMRLHFLRALVADKEIHAQVVPYMEKICLTCFRYLESEIWTIRNASLQLFGAIVPRLVGQSCSDASLDYGIGYSINHFVSHYPVLVAYVVKELDKFVSTFRNFSDALYRHSSIIPILILLSKFSNSGCNLIEYSSTPFSQKVKGLLYTLFENPVFYVRYLAAKAYAALTSLSDTEREVRNIQSDISLERSFNRIHGQLLAIKCLNEKLCIQMEYIKQNNEVGKNLRKCGTYSTMDNMLQILEDFPSGIKMKQPCYPIQSLLLELSHYNCKASSEFFSMNTEVLLHQKVQPGFFQFIELYVKLYAKSIKCASDIEIGMFKKIVNSSCVDQTLTFLYYVPSYIPIVCTVLEHLLLTQNSCTVVLQKGMVDFLLKFLRQTNLSDESETHVFRNAIDQLDVEMNELSEHTKLWHLKCTLILLFSDNQTAVGDVLLQICNMSVQEEESMREIAVEFLEFVLRRFKTLTEINQLMIIHACVILLKDEIHEIRERIAESVRRHLLPMFHKKHSAVWHEEIIGQFLLFEIMLGEPWRIYKVENLRFIKLFMSNIRNLDDNLEIKNPFYHDDSTFYREESKFLDICYICINESKKCTGVAVGQSSTDCYREMIIDSELIMKAKFELQENVSFKLADLLVVLNTKYADYLLRKQGTVIHKYSL